jgi:hypothetical protein
LVCREAALESIIIAHDPGAKPLTLWPIMR